MEIDEMIRIKDARGYSIRQIAEYSGVPEGTVRKIFAGQTENPRVATIMAIQKVLEGDESVYQGKNYVYDQQATESEYLQFIHQEHAADRMAEAAFSYGKKGAMTVADLEALPEECRAELIDGVIYDMGTASIVHQEIAMELLFQIRAYLRGKRNRKCKVIVNPGVQILRDNHNLLIPDLAVACRDKTAIGHYIEGAPVFCLEVVSKWSKKRDYVVKLNKYSQAGVEEYWIIDPFKKMLTVYVAREEYAPEISQIAGRRILATLGEDCIIDLDAVADILSEYEMENA